MKNVTPVIEYRYNKGLSLLALLAIPFLLWATINSWSDTKPRSGRRALGHAVISYLGLPISVGLAIFYVPKLIDSRPAIRLSNSCIEWNLDKPSYAMISWAWIDSISVVGHGLMIVSYLCVEEGNGKPGSPTKTYHTEAVFDISVIDGDKQSVVSQVEACWQDYQRRNRLPVKKIS